MGLLSGLFDKKKTTTENSTTNQTGTTNSTTNMSGQTVQSGTQTSNPWEAVTPFITGQNGLLNAAQGVFQQGQAGSGQVRDALSGILGQIQNNSGIAGQLQNVGQGILGMQLPQAQQVKGQYITNVPQVQAQNVGVLGSFGNLGPIDPTSAFQNQLSGDVKNTYIDQQLAANTDAAKANFNQMVSDATDNLTRNVLPVIRSGANMSGQYGGSRQGIAEGLAAGDLQKQLALSAQGLNAGLAQTNAGTLSNAFENAQNRQANSAQFLGGLGVSTDQANADRNLQAGMFNAGNALDVSKFNVANDADLNKFNAGVTLNNNAQNLGALQTGAGILGGVQDQTGGNLSQLLQALTGGQQYDQGNLNSYASILGNLAGLGGTTNTSGTTNQTGTTNMTGIENLIRNTSGKTTTTDSPSTLSKIMQAAQLAAMMG